VISIWPNGIYTKWPHLGGKVNAIDRGVKGVLLL